MAKLKDHFHITLNRLEENLSLFKLEDYIRQCEEEFDARINEIADRALGDRNIKVIFISGPSASGKTTSNDKLAVSLNSRGVSTLNMSLDDYYLTHEFPTDDHGRYNYESISTMDIDLIIKHIQDLVSGQEVQMPIFDFLAKEARLRPDGSRLEEGGILLVEGLHALSPLITGSIDRNKGLSVYIMPYATLTDDNNLLSYRDIRIIRRLVRDNLYRGADALSTIDYWPMLDFSEDSDFPIYLENADIYMNSILPYEFYVMAPLAKRAMEDSLLDYRMKIIDNSRLNKFGGYAQVDLALDTLYRLYKAVSSIPGINPSFVPDSSLLNEFIKK